MKFYVYYKPFSTVGISTFAYRSLTFRNMVVLDGKTPTELAGIQITGKNKWLTIIQNANRKDS